MIPIVDYRDTWPAEFERVAAALRSALGPAALRVDAIGSTAVPGLCAKDVIDVQVTVAALAPAIGTALQAAGFQLRSDLRQDHVPPGADPAPAEWAKLYCSQPAGQRRANIHVREAGRANQRYALLCRDFLRANPATAQAYGELKRRLATSLADDETYPDVKDPAVDLIYFAAEQWATQTGWRVPGWVAPLSDPQAEIQTLDSTVAYSNRWMSIREDKIRRADGSAGLYGIVEKSDYAVIAALGPEGLYLVEQYRYPVRARYWELPQGAWEGQKIDPLALARAELREETGLVAGQMRHAGRLFIAPGYSAQCYDVFLATDLAQHGTQPDPEEQGLVARPFALDTVQAMLLDGTIRDATTAAALGLLRLRGWL